MPAVSKAQQRFMGMVHAVKKGDMAAPSPEVAQAAASMKKKDAKDFASTKHKGLPDKIKVNEIYSNTDIARSEKIKKYDDDKKKFVKSDARMKHGKKWKDFTRDVDAAKNRLRKGEVKKFNKQTGKWESNKD